MTVVTDLSDPKSLNLPRDSQSHVWGYKLTGVHMHTDTQTGLGTDTLIVVFHCSSSSSFKSSSSATGLK